MLSIGSKDPFMILSREGYYQDILALLFSPCSQGHPRVLGSSGFGFVLHSAPELFFGNDFPPLVSPLIK